MPSDTFRIVKTRFGWKWQVLRSMYTGLRVRRSGWRLTETGARRAVRRYLARQENKIVAARARSAASYTYDPRDK